VSFVAIPIPRQSWQGGLRHLARIYNPTTDNIITDTPPFQRQFIHSTHQETKQSLSYSNYINHLLSPHVSPHNNAVSPRGDSFSTLLLHQSRSLELNSAHSLYYEMTTMRYNIEKEVGRGRLVMRSDRDMNEILLRMELMGVLMSYHGKWLGVGLGVVLGEGGMGWEVSVVLMNMLGSTQSNH
jgi:hypothetical protein